MSKMILTPHECQSETWQKLMKHYKPLLATYRNRLEVPSIQESERIALCWQIDAIKKLIALGEPDAKNVAGAG
jgi:hypothetical protein